MRAIPVYSLLSASLWQIALLILLISSSNLIAQQESDGEQELIRLQVVLDSIIENGIDSLAYPGAQLYVSVGGEPIIHKAYGYHTYDRNVPVALDHIYDLASVTKVSTGLPLLMKFSKDNRFDLDEPLKKYYPKFKKSNKGHLRFRDILSHQAGLDPYIIFWQKTIEEEGFFKRRTFSKKASRRYPIAITDDLYLFKRYHKKMFDAVKESKVAESPTYKYSGLIFLILPEIIKGITGEEFYPYLRKTLYDPLGASKMMYKPLANYPIDKIVPTENDSYFRNTLIRGYVHDEAAAMLNGISCNAGLFSNAEDLAKLFQMYLNGGVFNGRRYLVKEAIDEFTKYQFPENKNRRGLGFDKPLLEYDPDKSYVAKDASPSSFGHSGFTGTFVWADPKHDMLFIFLSNRVYPDRSHRKLYTMKLRPKMHQAVYNYLAKE